ncbi:enoyl-CoA hydratase/isomerase family protein [Nakamurella antarctica]|uniref:Enoyl-CoA hydratase/isomerase family protein n=1 Tax=Nakamurella antarctica TaxID=1902245 RepID=A0A3G8ZI47_9ACTN|nr:enoyl-CoA hydratase/isomerase family protein [Nakamurella antarctica]AZI57059.1 enoyl-CoA hydratase/isomerase family protein [Nakamurella antarctica]
MAGHTDGAITVEHHGHIAHVVLDRPKKLNAMTVAMDHQMNDLVHALNNDANVRVILLSGAGDRAFSAGSDITDLDEYGDNWSYRNRFDARTDYARAMWLNRKPVVAAIHGYCIGGGLEMACASDIRIATPEASFGAGEIKWGWHGGSGQTQLLTHLIGPGYASRLLLTGDRIDGAEALRIGLVQQIVPFSDLIDTAMAVALTIAGMSPIAVEKTKSMVRLAQNAPLDVALLAENDSFAYLMMTEDAAEGRAAFAEKRPPVFKGR